MTPAVAATGTFGPSTLLVFTAAYRGHADPGAWGRASPSTIVANNNVTNGFDLIVSQATTVNAATTYRVLETWTKLVVGGAAGAQEPEGCSTTRPSAPSTSRW